MALMDLLVFIILGLIISLCFFSKTDKKLELERMEKEQHEKMANNLEIMKKWYEKNKE